MNLTPFQKRLLAELQPDAWYDLTPSQLTGKTLPAWVDTTDNAQLDEINGLVRLGELMTQNHRGPQILKPFMKEIL